MSHNLQFAESGGGAANKIVAAVAIKVHDLEHDGKVEAAGADVVQVEGKWPPHGIEVVLDRLRAVDGHPAHILLACLLRAVLLRGLFGRSASLGGVDDQKGIGLREEIKV